MKNLFVALALTGFSLAYVSEAYASTSDNGTEIKKTDKKRKKKACAETKSCCSAKH